MIYLARRNPALAPQDFPQAWREHSALGRQCPNVQDKVRGVAQCSRVLDVVPVHGLADDYDGVNLLQLRDLQAATDIWTDADTLRVMRPDEPRVFSAYVRNFTLTCCEAVLRDAPQTEVCVIAFLRPRDAVEPGDFHRECMRNDGAPWLAVAAAARARRVVLNEVYAEPPPGYEFAMIIEWWFASLDELVDALGRRDVRELLPVAIAGRSDALRSVFMLTRITHRRP
uniref:EthD domain-containing protein n=2 Tax=Aromatoleum anaerobium TaxID=182180 RepID=A0ABX1PM04_9RHOO